MYDPTKFSPTKQFSPSVCLIHNKVAQHLHKKCNEEQSIGIMTHILSRMKNEQTPVAYNRMITKLEHEGVEFVRNKYKTKTTNKDQAEILEDIGRFVFATLNERDLKKLKDVSGPAFEIRYPIGFNSFGTEEYFKGNKNWRTDQGALFSHRYFIERSTGSVTSMFTYFNGGLDNYTLSAGVQLGNTDELDELRSHAIAAMIEFFGLVDSGAEYRYWRAGSVLNTVPNQLRLMTEREALFTRLIHFTLNIKGFKIKLVPGSSTDVVRITDKARKLTINVQFDPEYWRMEDGYNYTSFSTAIQIGPGSSAGTSLPLIKEIEPVELTMADIDHGLCYSEVLFQRLDTLIRNYFDRIDSVRSSVKRFELKS